MTQTTKQPSAIDAVLKYRRVIGVLLHAVLAVVANLSAFWLRFDGDVPEQHWSAALRFLPWLVALRLITFVPFRLFEGLWKYTSLWDLKNIVLGVLSSSMLFVAVTAWSSPEYIYPRSIYITDAVFMICLMTAIRLSRRIYGEGFRARGVRRVLIYGAGNAGEMIVREMNQHPRSDAFAVGFVDDDRSKHGQRIHGVQVLGGRAQITEIIRQQKPQEVLIAIPSAPRETLLELVRTLESHDVRITTLPSLGDLIARQVDIGQIRQLSAEDLLRRTPVGMMNPRIFQLVRGRSVLVTGAGGSIGAELCRQILAIEPRRLILVERHENSLFAIHAELCKAFPQAVVIPSIGDVTDYLRIDQLFARERPSVVFHAAAHKHVPMMEQNPCEAVKNNIQGTRILAQAAIAHGTEQFVLISTDKAVEPTSVMGATKYLAEQLIQQFDQSPTTFTAVRFGNVLGSSGSMVPTFVEQIKNGGPVTVTHPEMRRYFMLIPEAVSLVLHAASIGERGSVYVLNMGEQVRIVDVARQLIRLAGYVPDTDIKIVFTGIRPGEKLSESLVREDEMVEPSPVDNIQRVRSTKSNSPAIRAQLHALEDVAMKGDDQRVLALLTEILPSLGANGEKESEPLTTNAM
jgi:FlaA1/EpsC-like NDP-sugar epimerase